MTYGPNHRHVEGRLYSGHYSGEGYNRVRVCSCGAEDHDPDPEVVESIQPPTKARAGLQRGAEG